MLCGRQVGKNCLRMLDDFQVAKLGQLDSQKPKNDNDDD